MRQGEGLEVRKASLFISQAVRTGHLDTHNSTAWCPVGSYLLVFRMENKKTNKKLKKKKKDMV